MVRTEDGECRITKIKKLNELFSSPYIYLIKSSGQGLGFVERRDVITLLGAINKKNIQVEEGTN